MKDPSKQIFIDILIIFLIMCLVAVGIATFHAYGTSQGTSWGIYGLAAMGLMIWAIYYLKLKKPKRNPRNTKQPFSPAETISASVSKNSEKTEGLKNTRAHSAHNKEKVKSSSLIKRIKDKLSYTPPLGKACPSFGGPLRSLKDSLKRLLFYNHLGRKLMKPKIGILTASDRAHAGTYQDISGEAIKEALRDFLEDEFEVVYRLQPDEFEILKDTLMELTDQEGCCLVFTTGGTGPSPRDVTPEATEAVGDKILPGFGEEMRRQSLKFTPTAIVSRQLAVTRGRSLIVNLPGKPRAIMQCLDAVFSAIPDVIDLIGGPRLKCQGHVNDFRHNDR